MKFTKTHEWIKIEGDLAIMGITDHAQKELGEIVYLEFPSIGRDVKAGDEIAVLESTKAAVDLYTPLSGRVFEINSSLAENPQKINDSAETEGWILKIKFNNPKELDLLLDEKDYRSSLNKSH